jgi:DMSO/TMAO reductase YedYZ molybdopterin-dependent catalytic subunit
MMSWKHEWDLVDESVYQARRADERLWQQARQRGVSRRRLLQGLAAGGSAALMFGGVPAGRAQGTPPAVTPELVVKPTPPEHFFDYGTNKEMRWEAMYGRGYVVPNDLFFVRDHTRTPRLDAATWRLSVAGTGLERALDLTYEDILAMPSHSVVRYVECAGNGRSLFETAYGKKAQGTQWKLGAIGVAEWTGVQLSTILDHAGLKRTARDVMAEGLDDLKVRRPISVTKALAEDTLLVYAMNGAPLPPDHGFPVRLLTPGWIGVSNIKWVGRLEVSEESLFSHWNTETYVLLGPDYPPNPPANGPMLSMQNPKSALELAQGAQLRAGLLLIKGRSWSPFGKIARVMYSLDRGKTWQQARLREPNIAGAWARWDFPWEAQPGQYTITVQAMDTAGNIQPDSVPWNEQGYLYNAAVHHAVTVA